jgi:hypothetical protein
LPITEATSVDRAAKAFSIGVSGVGGGTHLPDATLDNDAATLRALVNRRP